MKTALEKDVLEKGVAVFDVKNKTVIDMDNLAFFWLHRPGKVRSKLQLCSGLARILKIYKGKFGVTSPYDLELYHKDPALFIERMIRAAEICTLKYVLNLDGGGLNDSTTSLVFGKNQMHWESK